MHAVQHECIPHAILGMDVLCQAKSGMGKTAVFVLAILQQLDVKPGEVSAIVLCHTRELAYQVGALCSHHQIQFNRTCPAFSPQQVLLILIHARRVLLLQICHEFERFTTRLRNIKIANFFGGTPVAQHRELLKKDVPPIIVGTPGRVKQVG